VRRRSVQHGVNFRSRRQSSDRHQRGEPTLSSFNAVATLFDNRLKAAEKRKESYRLTIPEGAKGDVAIEVVLKYRPYSSTFTDRFGLESSEPVIVARRQIRLSAPQGR
jgi:hypothetical protein